LRILAVFFNIPVITITYFVTFEVKVPSQSISYGTTLTAAADLTRAAHNFKTTLFDRSTAADLDIQKADWAVGDWFVIRQVGDGQATITPEDTDVVLPDWDKTAGKGFDMYIECYKIVGNVKTFHITGGVE
jgi:hypothetical protein